jgi:hypothetical protein
MTERQLEIVREESKPEPKLTRSQQRYRAFLDADSGETFIDWLRSISRSQRRANNS